MPAEILVEGRYLRFCRQDHWEFVQRSRGPLAVVLLAVTDADELLLVEQFRIPVGRNTVELPAGLVGDDDDEDTVQSAARRELLEETGFVAERLTELVRGPVSAGLSDEAMVFVRAEGLTEVGAGGGDESEDIIVHRVPLQSIEAFLAARAAADCAIDPKLYAGLWFIRDRFAAIDRQP